MLKIDVIKNVQKVTGSTLKDATAAVDAVLETISAALAEGEEVLFTGFGKFSVKTRKAREGVNPQDTSKRIHLPESKVPSFRSGKSLKDRVSDSKKGKK